MRYLVCISVAAFAMFADACSSSTPQPKAAPASTTSAKPLETPHLRLTQPTAQQVVTSPLQVRGEARGTWYFEASFPLELLDENKGVIARGYAQAEGEWMTENFVPFHGELVYESAPSAKGTLVLRKANASGLPEHDQAIELPVSFAIAQP